MRIRVLAWRAPVCLILVGAVSRAAPIGRGPGGAIAIKLAHGSGHPVLTLHTRHRNDDEVMQFWASDRYTWIYTQVLQVPEAVGKVVKAHGLVPSRA